MTNLTFWWLVSLSLLAYGAGIETPGLLYSVKYLLMFAGNVGVGACAFVDTIQAIRT